MFNFEWQSLIITIYHSCTLKKEILKVGGWVITRGKPIQNLKVFTFYTSQNAGNPRNEWNPSFSRFTNHLRGVILSASKR